MRFVKISPIPCISEIDESTEEMAKLCTLTKDALRTGLDALTKFKNKELSALGEYSKAIFENGAAEVALGEVPTLTVAAMGVPNHGIVNMIVAPVMWVKECLDNSFLEFGAIVFCCSQVIDIYNMKFERTLERAKSFEAEYLLSIPGERLNKYQSGVLAKYPDGLDHSLLYERKPIELLN